MGAAGSIESAKDQTAKILARPTDASDVTVSPMIDFFGYISIHQPSLTCQFSYSLAALKGTFDSKKGAY